MADAASIGANFSSYTGNAALGGGDLGVAKIDTSPIQNLAYYTFQYNKSEYDQRQKDTDAKIKELAKLSSIRLNDLHGKDKDMLTKKLLETIKYGRDVYSKNDGNAEDKIKGELDWQVNYGALLNDYNSGKERAVQYAKQKNDILTKFPSPKTQDEKMRQLDAKFDSSDIGTPISDDSAFNLEKPAIPKFTEGEAVAVKVGGNQNAKITMKYFSPQNANLASAAALGMLNKYIAPKIKDASGKEIDNPKFLALSKSEQNEQSQLATVEGQLETYTKNTEVLNSVMSEERFKKDGVFDVAAFRAYAKGNVLLEPILTQIDRINKYAQDKEAQQRSRVMQDDVDGDFSLPDAFSQEDFSKLKIDLASGSITSDKLALAAIFGQYGTDSVAKALTETANKNQMDIAKMQNATTRENNRLDNSLGWYNAKTSRISADKPSGSGAGYESVNDIYGRIENTVNTNNENKIPNTPLANLDVDQQAVVLEQANKGKGEGDKLKVENLVLVKQNDGRMGIHKKVDQGYDFVGYLPRVGTNLKAQPSVKEKRQVVNQGAGGGVSDAEFQKLLDQAAKKK